MFIATPGLGMAPLETWPAAISVAVPLGANSFKSESDLKEESPS